MTKRIVLIAIECLFDLGLTIVYASLAGLLIAAITVSDGGVSSLLPALFYAALLPIVVLALIVVDAALRAFGEGRAARRSVRPAPGFSGAVRSALR